MHRNLDRRVEALVTVTDRPQRDGLLKLMDLAMDEGTHGWWLDGEGTWTRHEPPAGEALLDIQTHLVKSRRWRTVDG
jgi:polyphosphate kinase